MGGLPSTIRNAAGHVPLASVALIAWVVAGALTDFAPEPEILFASPRPGDRGHYEIQLGLPNGATADGGDLWFEVGDPRPFQDGRSGRRTELPVQMLARDQTGDWPFIVHLDARTFEGLATTSLLSSMRSASGILWTSEQRQSNTWQTEFEVVEVPCGFVHSAFGRALAKVPRVDAYGCPPYNGIPRSLVATHDRDGTGALTLASDDIELDVRPDIPYPIRILVPGSWPFDGPSSWTQLRLVGFERGFAPAVVPPAKDPQPMPEVRWARVDRIGPDDSGLSHPFPLRQAFSDVVGEVSFRDLRDYLARNPDWYVSSARYFEHGAPDDSYVGWFIDFAARLEGLSVTVEHHRFRAVAAPLVQSPLLQQTRYDASPRPGTPTTLADFPAELPSLAYVRDRWSVFTGGAPDEGYRWAFERSLEEGWPRIRLRVGDLAPSIHASADGGFPLLAPPHSHELTGSALVVNGTGHPVAINSMREDVQWRSPQEGLAPPVPPTPSQPRPVGALRDGVAGPEAFAAVFAALAALLLKRLAIGLFTRLRRGDVLQHPLRARVLQEIQASPGLHVQEVARRIGRSRRTIKHHVDVLVSAGLIAVSHGPRETSLFARVTWPSAMMQGIALLRSPASRGLLADLQHRPGSSSLEAARRLGRSPATVHHHVKRLLAAGLLTNDAKGPHGALRLRVTHLGQAALKATGGPSMAGPLTGFEQKSNGDITAPLVGELRS